MDCLFCKIIKGEVPCSKIYEDEKVLAFLDIGPVNKGHTLVVPKKHAVNIFDIEKEDWSAVNDAVKKIAHAVKKGSSADGVNIMSSNGEVAGQLIMHSHIHIIPRLKDDGLKLWPGKEYKEGEMDEFKEKITSFSNNYHKGFQP